jgi:inhibitor of cysteine peptidase
MRTRMIIPALALLGILVNACSTGAGTLSPTTMTVEYDEFAQTKNVAKQITVRAGSELVVNLPSNPSTGYSWTDAVSGAPGVLDQTASEYIAPSGRTAGTGGTQVWTFKASSRGSTTVKADYSRPWEGGEKGHWTFQLVVTVK